MFNICKKLIIMTMNCTSLFIKTYSLKNTTKLTLIQSSLTCSLNDSHHPTDLNNRGGLAFKFQHETLMPLQAW